MVTVRQQVRIRRSPEEVWRVVADAGAVADWFPGMSSSVLIGDVRECTMGSGLTVQERIVTSDGALRRLQYRVIGGLPFTHHLATIDVLDDDRGGAIVIYGADLEPGDGTQMSRAFAGALTSLKAMLERHEGNSTFPDLGARP
jgi:hypothetical protein